jgi:hypothetical protein
MKLGSSKTKELLKMRTTTNSPLTSQARWLQTRITKTKLRKSSRGQRASKKTGSLSRLSLNLHSSHNLNQLSPSTQSLSKL